ncbi:hypothetical protein T440DRAFT_187406 [Plenodomus tracheiphilus IPT5]|uniref:Uncharacterized protein n=1 Tax=Plenodomus tracheiphilus IPT5 TaxID=1408161 RepID=A0A6A7B008_9PLEO|nr:hypothetical protein T440DRAFT_187406 [Plenodomus tracheiphilus IPT5]
MSSPRALFSCFRPTRSSYLHPRTTTNAGARPWHRDGPWARAFEKELCSELPIGRATPLPLSFCSPLLVAHTHRRQRGPRIAPTPPAGTPFVVAAPNTVNSSEMSLHQCDSGLVSSSACKRLLHSSQVRSTRPLFMPLHES